MRIKVRLPKVVPNVYDELEECPKEGCDGRHFKPHSLKGEKKAVRDLSHQEVESFRWQCLKCKRTFRVYPRGVSSAHQSDRLKGITVLLYILGLSYGAVSDFMDALGCEVCKTTVYNNVQATGEKARKRQQNTVKRGGKRAVIGADGTYVKIKGEQVGIEVVVDDESGELLGLDIIVSENSEEVLKVIRDVTEDVEADVIVSDDHGAYKEVAIELGLEHQICRSHAKRNVDELAESIREQLKKKEPLLKGVDSSPEDLVGDLESLQELIRERPKDALDQLETLYHRYKAAPVPKKGQRHTVWYRTRMLVTRLWERWPNLTRLYADLWGWKSLRKAACSHTPISVNAKPFVSGCGGQPGQIWKVVSFTPQICVDPLTLEQRRDDLDGTNNGSERLIGWWIKERYRSMRGYKRPKSVKNVVTLTARMGVRSGHYEMTELYS